MLRGTPQVYHLWKATESTERSSCGEIFREIGAKFVLPKGYDPADCLTASRGISRRGAKKIPQMRKWRCAAQPNKNALPFLFGGRAALAVRNKKVLAVRNITTYVRSRGRIWNPLPARRRSAGSWRDGRARRAPRERRAAQWCSQSPRRGRAEGYDRRGRCRDGDIGMYAVEAAVRRGVWIA